MGNKIKTDKSASSQKKASSPSAHGQALPVFYNNPVPISKERHGASRLLPISAAQCVGSSNAIPVNLAEFGLVSRHYPIAFVPGKNPFPVAIVGLRKGQNLFVGDDGMWAKGEYVPAYVRRYPFILMSENGGDSLALGIDEVEGVVGEGDGVPIYDENGDPSENTKAALEFCKAYNTSVGPTQAFVRELIKSDLLVDRQANVVRADGEKISLTGFQVVDAEKTQDLGAETIHQWWRSGWAQAVTAHRISLLNWGSLADRS